MRDREIAELRGKCAYRFFVLYSKTSLARLHEFVLSSLLFRPALWLDFGGFLWLLHFLDVNLVPYLIVRSAILMYELSPFWVTAYLKLRSAEIPSAHGLLLCTVRSCWDNL